MYIEQNISKIVICYKKRKKIVVFLGTSMSYFAKMRKNNHYLEVTILEIAIYKSRTLGNLPICCT